MKQTVPDAARDNHYDLIVIGSGQGGGPLAGAFARAGRRVALIERVHIGGTCINEGCSPTKTIIASARVAHVAHRARNYGVHACDGATTSAQVDMGRVRERKQQIVDSFRSGSERALTEAGVDVIRGQARFVAPRAVEIVRAPTEGSSDALGATALTAHVVVINTGLRASVPQLPGVENVPYLTSTSIMELTHVPEHLLVLGGG